MIDFWVSIGSTYSYLSVMRLKAVEEASGVSFRWRPFSVRAIMVEQENIPFDGKPVKMAYMWRDIERRARKYGFEPRLPAPYPLAEFDLTNKIAVVGETEGWCADYVRAAYRQWFHSGHEPGSEPGVSEALRELGRDPARVLASARTGRSKSATSATPRKRRRSAYSAPRPSSSTARFFGATTASRTRLRGSRGKARTRPGIGRVSEAAFCALHPPKGGGG